ncbi:glyoxylase-like metal-dependent hydrolase (beta-lactamase superfamily II) [Kitasatospora sp. MAP12-15]|uniref:MBL fold metallo-hydrolase n=1 Tax=unclassified Kitasatospora TaxID=2633591 RepID=UPI002475B455|nr:MBL fold metallo-hydrolase [Kitasatospora sp. MAP12-44]MDH6111853.1 glyoxylase-like metal-dependent hydrolase (beta-lactamase superfamily II) [Kitasatospora sp. MAP12-44]
MTSSPPPEESADRPGGANGGGRQDGSRGAAAPGPTLEIDVFVGPESAFFVTSTLIIGRRDAILVDAQLTRSAGRELAEWIAGKDRNLLAIVITHPHPDHYFGVEEVLRLFPQAHVLAAPQVVDEIVRTAAGKVVQWRPVFGDDLPEAPVVPRALLPQPLMIDRQLIRVLYLGQGDSAHCTVVHVPGARTVIAGDLVYNGTHVWTAETTPAERGVWAQNLGRIADLGVERVIAGHRAPDQDDDAARVLTFTDDYLKEFDRLLAEHPGDPEGLVTAMSERFWLTLPQFLELGAAANTARPAEPVSPEEGDEGSEGDEGDEGAEDEEA